MQSSSSNPESTTHGFSALFSEQLLDALIELDLTLADLGARGSIDGDLAPLASAASVIGFEPDAAEAERLGTIAGPWRHLTVLPYAVGAQDGAETLHVPAAVVGASLLPHNEGLIESFGHASLLRTLRRVPVCTRSLDSLAAEGVLPRVDYLKIDIEGAELAVLQSASRVLSECVAVKVECAFIEQRVGQPLAHQVVEFMAANGFALVDVLDIHRWRRRNLPAHPYTVRSVMPYSKGCVAQADLLFFRSLFAASAPTLVNRSVLISACLGYFDHAWTLVQQHEGVSDWWSSRGVDIRAELRAASRRVGRAAIQGAVLKHVRQLIPMIRSLCGVLPFTEPRDPPY